MVTAGAGIVGKRAVWPSEKLQSRAGMESTQSCRVVVANPHGLHARPADAFVKLAKQFQARVEVVCRHERVDGKSILDILTLAAVAGTELTLEATGVDAAEALDALSKLIESDFGENPGSSA